MHTCPPVLHPVASRVPHITSAASDPWVSWYPAASRSYRDPHGTLHMDMHSATIQRSTRFDVHLSNQSRRLCPQPSLPVLSAGSLLPPVFARGSYLPAELAPHSQCEFPHGSYTKSPIPPIIHSSRKSKQRPGIL